MIDYFEASKTYDNTRSTDESVIELMARRGAFAPGSRVLDFGCGTGNYLSEMGGRFGCELFGAEPSAGMRERARAKNPGLRIEEGDHGGLPYDDGFFDLIYMTDVIHHVPDLELLFGTLAAKLARGGRICVATESWRQIDGRWYNAYFPSLAGNEKGRYPDLATIEACAGSAGLRSAGVDVKGNPGPHAVDKAFLRMVGEKNYSMFRMLGEAEYEAGYAALRRDEGRSFLSPGAGESLLWLEKGGAR
jgi:SAM-dependent methyltransferase